MSLIPARLDGVALAVEDIERSSFFYREVLGFDQTDASDELARFRLENIRLTLVLKSTLLEEMHLPDLPAPPGPTTLAISVSRPEVDVLMEKLETAGVRIIARAEDKRLGPRIGFAADPDGHVLEIIEDY
jgi:catechol 2,3-dioxygenase-like lactoylglutathione lyase family enzyme